MTETQTLQAIDQKANANLSTARGQNVIAKLRANKVGQSFEVSIRRTQRGFYAVTATTRTKFYKRPSSAFLMICGQLKAN